MVASEGCRYRTKCTKCRARRLQWAKRHGKAGCWAVGPPLSLGLSRAVQGKPVVADNLRALPPAPVPPFTAALGHPVIWPPCWCCTKRHHRDSAVHWRRAASAAGVPRRRYVDVQRRHALLTITCRLRTAWGNVASLDIAGWMRPGRERGASQGILARLQWAHP